MDEIRKLLDILEEIDKTNKFEDDIEQKDVCPQCGSPDCTCPPGDCDCDPVNEGYPFGMPVGQDKDSENISYSKTKTVGDSTLTISANAKSMEELHKLLQMAGLDPEKSDVKLDQPEAPADPFDKDSDDVCDCCGKEIVDGSCGCDDHSHPTDDHGHDSMGPGYSTDKETLLGMIRDRLKQKLS